MHICEKAADVSAVTLARHRHKSRQTISAPVTGDEDSLVRRRLLLPLLDLL